MRVFIVFVLTLTWFMHLASIKMNCNMLWEMYFRLYFVSFTFYEITLNSNAIFLAIHRDHRFLQLITRGWVVIAVTINEVITILLFTDVSFTNCVILKIGCISFLFLRNYVFEYNNLPNCCVIYQKDCNFETIFCLGVIDSNYL